MKTLKFFSHCYEDTLALGARFAKFLKAGDIVCLFGDLGAGKTAFTKGIAKGLGIDPNKVHSPTFVLMNIYEAKCPVYHFDLYRIGAADLFDLGYEEFFYGKGIAVIEWSERLGDLMPKDHWHVELKHAGGDERSVAVSFEGTALKERFTRVSGRLS
ncbi:MAG: tRNA (adenosine(37)-N6)-threonylcarbamoyltransferase complex ATPase subunit type 1 TsaE [Candidatus Omnitrophica bacterium]|nr:tRNA (adenosine(37)-N6)-threonylcarbamoyltransferase complex ATPase subunit type 1 TsaE [Candidatus Omnitrophota bacterium]